MPLEGAAVLEEAAAWHPPLAAPPNSVGSPGTGGGGEGLQVTETELSGNNTI